MTQEERDAIEGMAFALDYVAESVRARPSGCSGDVKLGRRPLTHRDCAQSCIFVTGHLKDGTADLDWAALARPRQTVVIYMGLLGLATICQQLVAHGLPADTPAAVVERATLASQRVIAATLAELPNEAQLAGLIGPTLIIVGQVVDLRQRLNWYQRL